MSLESKYVCLKCGRKFITPPWEMRDLYDWMPPGQKNVVTCRGYIVPISEGTANELPPGPQANAGGKK